MKILLQAVIFIGCASAFVLLLKKSYEMGYVQGYNQSTQAAQTNLDNMMALVQNGAISYKKNTPTPTKTPIASAAPKPVNRVWTGPELWEAVNKRRTALGVNALSQRDEICTIASIRLNQLLERGKLDGHEGFSKLPEERADLRWIYDKYNLSEFLVSGATSPQDAVSLWENTLGHKKLLTGGEYVWGCIYAQNSFAVAIAAY